MRCPQKRDRLQITGYATTLNPKAWDAVVLANGPIQANRPKWLGEGAKGLLGQGSKSLKKGSCTTKTLFCTGATQHFTGAKGIWPDCTQRPFAPSPNHFGAISLNPAICQDHSFPTQGGTWTTEVECQTPARSTSSNSCSTGPALWDFFRKVLYSREKALAYRGKGGQNTDIDCLSCLEVRGGSPPPDQRQAFLAMPPLQGLSLDYDAGESAATQKIQWVSRS